MVRPCWVCTERDLRRAGALCLNSWQVKKIPPPRHHGVLQRNSLIVLGDYRAPKHHLDHPGCGVRRWRWKKAKFLSGYDCKLEKGDVKHLSATHNNLFAFSVITKVGFYFFLFFLMFEIPV